MNTYSSVGPDTMIDLFLDLNTCYNRWPPRMRINNKTRPPSEFASLLAHTVTAILDCHSRVHFNSFQTVFTKIGSHIALLWCVQSKGQTTNTYHRRKLKTIHTIYMRHILQYMSFSLSAFISLSLFNSMAVRYAIRRRIRTLLSSGIWRRVARHNVTRYFRGIYCFHLQGTRVTQASNKQVVNQMPSGCFLLSRRYIPEDSTPHFLLILSFSYLLLYVYF
jgi:hypothetical protein